MKKIMALSLSLLTAALLLAFSSICAAGPQDFQLINQTGYEIAALKLCPTSTEDWQEDILGQQVLGNNDTIEISFDCGDVADWDIQAVFKDGSAIGWYNINLLATSKVTLQSDGSAKLD